MIGQEIDAYQMVMVCCGRPGGAGRQVAVLWLSASYDWVVVICWEGSFPPWTAAAAAHRLVVVLELCSFVHYILYWDVG
eukprot:scaffold91270_cov43-Attheya_sp.AAC.1